MVKVTIVNLNTLLDSVVTSNIAVQTAQSAVTNATVQAVIATESAEAAALSKSQIDQQIVEIEGLSDDIDADRLSIIALKDVITALEAAIATNANQITLDKATVATMLEEVLTAKSGVDVKAELIEELVEDFHTKYLGSSMTEPTVSWGGMELSTGMLYFDTVKDRLMIWQDSNKWGPVNEAIGALLTANNLSDLIDIAVARTNLDVMSTSEIEAQIQADIAAIKGKPLGLAELDANGLVPAGQLPSYVDDVLEVATKADLPVIGEAGKIYIVVTDELSNNDTSSYRWTGTVYAMVSNTITAADVKALYESNLDTNAYTDAEQVKVGYITVTQAVDLDTIESDTALNNTHRTSDGTDHTYIDQDVTTTATPTFAGLVTAGLVDGRDISVDGLKLDGIEAGATADQTASEIEVLYEGIADTNKYTDAEKTKLSNTEITTQLNDRDTANRDRANHTGTQSIDTVTETAGLKVMTSTERTVLDAATPLTTTATTLTTAINELDSGKVNTTDVISVTNGGTGATDAAGARTNLDVPQATEINAVLGTAVNKRYDKRLAALDIIDMEYTSGDLVTVRYTGDNDTSVFYRDVLAYVTGDLVTVKHYCNTADLVTESGLTTLVYDIDKNLISSSYTEV